jgi:hypothetical protein
MVLEKNVFHNYSNWPTLLWSIIKHNYSTYSIDELCINKLLYKYIFVIL